METYTTLCLLPLRWAPRYHDGSTPRVTTCPSWSVTSTEGPTAEQRYPLCPNLGQYPNASTPPHVDF
jgi:hypothetical protein